MARRARDAAVAPPILQRPPRVDRMLAGALSGDAGYRTVRPSGTTDWLLVYTVAGRGAVRVPRTPDDRAGASGASGAAGAAGAVEVVEVVAEPRSIVAIAPGTPQDYGTAEGSRGWQLLWTHLHPRSEWLPLLDWPEAAPGVRLLALPDIVAGRVERALSRAGSLSRTGLRHAALFGMNAVEEALLWCDTQNPHGARLDPRVLVVLDQVSAHLDRPHSVTSLARVAGISPSRLSHLFVTQLGSSLMAYVERQRMELARQLLEVSSFSVAEIAQRVGYPDPLYFSRRFRRAAGVSPTAYRLERT